jgi:hypothetical protein
MIFDEDINIMEPIASERFRKTPRRTHAIGAHCVIVLSAIIHGRRRLPPAFL